MATKMTLKQRVKRDEKIRKLYDEKGMSTRQIAEKVGLSKTRVHEIVAYE
jgi:DNA-binding transcriptional regulator LsrR (DeoR family)